MMPPSGSVTTRGDAVHARDRNDVAVRIHRDLGARIRIDVAQLRGVDRAGNGADLFEADLRAGVDQTGIDEEARAVDDRRVRREPRRSRRRR